MEKHTGIAGIFVIGLSQLIKKGLRSLNFKDISVPKRPGIRYIPQDLDSQLFGEDLVDELTTGLKDSEKDIEKAERILEKFGLIFLKDKHPATLSGGQKQRLVFRSRHDAECAHDYSG